MAHYGSMNLRERDDKNVMSLRKTFEEIRLGSLENNESRSKKAKCEMENEGFWCHERSPLIHPVGWAQIIGHALKGQPEYATESLLKCLYRTFEPDDATWDMFLPVINPVRELQFKPGMKLEAIDPLNLSTICVATVTEVLRNNYLMIGIDGMMAANGSDCFCYHASSPCIFPVGFCEEHGIQLTPPRGYKGDFKWSEYLKKTKSDAAPVDLFHRDIPDHGFKERMYLEAVDLREPRLIRVAYITKVVGRLLRVHFEGWEDDYDQWCDCDSPDLFPVGWCDVLGYELEPPRADPNAEDKKKKKTGEKSWQRSSPTIHRCVERMSAGSRKNYPLRFHLVHGKHIQLSKKRTVASRVLNFCSGLVFGDRPIEAYELVYVKIRKISPSWEDALRIGFTTNNPSALNKLMAQIPDLTSTRGTWVEGVEEELTKQNSVLFYYFDANGYVHYGSGSEVHGLLFGGLDISKKLWAVLDVYGNTVTVELVANGSTR